MPVRSIRFRATHGLAQLFLSAWLLAVPGLAGSQEPPPGVPKEPVDTSIPRELIGPETDETGDSRATDPAQEAEAQEAEAEDELDTNFEESPWHSPGHSPSEAPRPVEGSGQLDLTVGAGRLLTLPEPVTRVAVADEQVVRVQIVSPREVLITGLEPGKTTLFVWLNDGRRLRYHFRAQLDLALLSAALVVLDPDIRVESSPNGKVLVLKGDVENSKLASRAKMRAESLLKTSNIQGIEVVDLLRHPDPDFSPDDRLSAALKEVDLRIHVRRVQVGPEPDAQKDTYVLEGRVRNVPSLIRALTLAERQLGGSGIGVVPVEGRSQGFARRNRNFNGNDHSPQQGRSRTDNSASDHTRSSSLVAEISRGLIMTTPSGRVISFLEVDDIPQILVSIRVMEVDRGKAKRVGVNFRFDNDHVSFGNYTGPQQGQLPGLFGQQPTVTPIEGGNLAFAFVDQVMAITAAIDFLADHQVARSVAEPNVLTLSGERATIRVGGEVPIPTTTINNTSSVQGFQFQEFGVRLDLRPTLDEKGIITLEVSPSIIRPEVALSVSNVPGFSVQSVRTTARLRTGQSLVIGGLLDFEESLEQRGLPLLGKIPFFRWRRRHRAETELIFVISPRLVDIDANADDKPPQPPIPPLDLERLRLPELPWPEDRDGWREEFEPRPLGPEGAPEDFLRDPEEELEEELGERDGSSG